MKLVGLLTHIDRYGRLHFTMPIKVDGKDTGNTEAQLRTLSRKMDSYCTDTVSPINMEEKTFFVPKQRNTSISDYDDYVGRKCNIDVKYSTFTFKKKKGWRFKINSII
jgi:hypothetical protein